MVHLFKYLEMQNISLVTSSCAILLRFFAVYFLLNNFLIAYQILEIIWLLNSSPGIVL